MNVKIIDAISAIAYLFIFLIIIWSALKSPRTSTNRITAPRSKLRSKIREINDLQEETSTSSTISKTIFIKNDKRIKELESILEDKNKIIALLEKQFETQKNLIDASNPKN